MSDTEISTTEEPAQSRPNNWRRPGLLVLLALGLGIATEILFYGHTPGISIPIWVVLAELVLLTAGWLEGQRPAMPEAVFTGLISFFAVMSVLRQEGLSSFLAIIMIMGLFTLWLRSYRSRRIFEFGWLDYLEALLIVPLEIWIRPWGVLGQVQREGSDGTTQNKQRQRAILKGVLLALPVLIMFTALLSSADLVFAGYVEELVEFLRLENFKEIIGRGVMILMSSLFCLGALALALRARSRQQLINNGKPLTKPFLQILEISIVLGSVDLLFLVFVLIQFRYLFGGTANINVAGYTYAEYARSGFGELVAVAVLSLMMISGLAAWTKREKRADKNIFNGLGLTLVAANLVVLASSLMRLLLYEETYGFSRIRTYTHVMILWMAALFVAFAVLLLVARMKHLPLVLAVFAICYSASINLLNVDAFIVRQNLAHPRADGKLDADYLAGLSDDAVPEIMRSLSSRILQSPQAFNQLAAEMACRRDYRNLFPVEGWQQIHFTDIRAGQALSENAELIEAFTTNEYEFSWEWEVSGPDYEGFCRGDGFW